MQSLREHPYDGARVSALLTNSQRQHGWLENSLCSKVWAKKASTKSLHLHHSNYRSFWKRQNYGNRENVRRRVGVNKQNTWMLEQWSYFVWYFNVEYMSSHSCPNPRMSTECLTQRVQAPATKHNDLSLIPGSTWWKARTDFHGSFSDFHKCTVVCVGVHTNEQTKVTTKYKIYGLQWI